MQGDIDGMCLGLDLVGEVVPHMLLPPATAAVRPAAVFGDADEAGSKHGAGGAELLEACLSHPEDQGRVCRDTHRGTPFM